MKLVWPDSVVEHVGLARNISLPRQAMGSGGEDYIETIPRRGDRLTAGEDAARGQRPAVTWKPIPPLVAGAGFSCLRLACTSSSPCN